MLRFIIKKKEAMMFKVLIVSTSNTHKGPMAEGLLKKKDA